MYSRNYPPTVDKSFIRREHDLQFHHMMTGHSGTSNFKNIHAAIPLSPSPYHPPSTPTFYSIPPSPSPSMSPSHWNHRAPYSNPPHPLTPTSSRVPISPASSPMLHNSIAFLEEILSKEHTICLQVRSLSTTIAKLTKDVLATGKACPNSFVGVLKDQVAKMQNLLATLHLIEQNKKSFPPDFVREITIKWQQRVSSKQKGTRKRKGSSESQDLKEASPIVHENKQRKMFVVIPTKESIIKTEPQTPNGLMNISNIIN